MISLPRMRLHPCRRPWTWGAAESCPKWLQKLCRENVPFFWTIFLIRFEHRQKSQPTQLSQDVLKKLCFRKVIKEPKKSTLGCALAISFFGGLLMLSADGFISCSILYHLWVARLRLKREFTSGALKTSTNCSTEISINGDGDHARLVWCTNTKDSVKAFLANNCAWWVFETWIIFNIWILGDRLWHIPIWK